MMTGKYKFVDLVFRLNLKRLITETGRVFIRGLLSFKENLVVWLFFYKKKS